MTVAENIAYTLTCPNHFRTDVTSCSAAGLTGHISRLPGRYPAEKQGLHSQALAPAKNYILMDEPLVNLDPTLKTEIHTLIKSETRGRGVLYVTHDEDELAGFADRMLHIRDGEIVG
jgi:ABC-type sugar transport system ATPase subunit